MKRAIPIVLIVMLFTILLSGCSDTQASPSPLPSGFVAPFENVQYEAIPPVNPELAKEVKIELPADMTLPQVIALAGGGALTLGQKITYGASKEIKTSKLMAARYNKDGRVVWTKVYTELKDGTVVDVKALRDGGFFFTYSALITYANGRYTPDTQFIIFCNPEGEIWNKFDRTQSEVFRFPCVTDSAPLKLFVVGEIKPNDGTIGDPAGQESEKPVVSLLVFDASTNIFLFGDLELNSYSNPSNAVWSGDTGLVLSVDKRNTGEKIITAIDDNGKTKWEYIRDEQNKLFFGHLLATKNGILAEGCNDGKEFILKLGIDGKKLWEIVPDEGTQYSVLCMAALANSSFAVVINRYGDADATRGEYLTLYDQNGKALKSSRLPNEMIREILPTEDGGWITVGMQNVKALPQPAYVNSIWYDTETIATKYSADFTIQWRKVYDRYVNMTKQDIVVPLANGSVITEK